jgi:hypothetical protein
LFRKALPVLWKSFFYLSQNGGIGGERFKVKLAEELQRYALPLKPQDEKDAIKTSLSFLELAKKEITLPLYAILYLSPLTTILDPMPNFSGYLYLSLKSYDYSKKSVVIKK